MLWILYKVFETVVGVGDVKEGIDSERDQPQCYSL